MLLLDTIDTDLALDIGQHEVVGTQIEARFQTRFHVEVGRKVFRWRHYVDLL